MFTSNRLKVVKQPIFLTKFGHKNMNQDNLSVGSSINGNFYLVTI